MEVHLLARRRGPTLPLPTRLAVTRNPAAAGRGLMISKTWMRNGVNILDPGTLTTGLSSGVTVGGTGSSLGQTTGEAAVMRDAVNKSATLPVEGPGTDVKQQNATKPVEAPGAGTATQPVEAPGAGPEVLPTGTGSATLHVEFTGSDSEVESQ